MDIICVIAPCGRSFLKLKLMKRYLQSNMGQARLFGMAFLSIVKEVAKNVDFEDVIAKSFAIVVLDFCFFFLSRRQYLQKFFK